MRKEKKALKYSLHDTIFATYSAGTEIIFVIVTVGSARWVSQFAEKQLFSRVRPPPTSDLSRTASHC